MKTVKDRHVLVGADFAGFPLKEAVVKHLKSKGWKVIEHSLGDGFENRKNFYEFHKLAIDEPEAFDYRKFKANNFEVIKLGEVDLAAPAYGVLAK